MGVLYFLNLLSLYDSIVEIELLQVKPVFEYGLPNALKFKDSSNITNKNRYVIQMEL